MPIRPTAPVDPMATTQELPRLYSYADILNTGAVAGVSYGPPRSIVTTDGTLLKVWRMTGEDAWALVREEPMDTTATARSLLVRATQLLAAGESK